jgi:hypothetical protein
MSTEKALPGRENKFQDSVFDESEKHFIVSDLLFSKCQ